MNEVPNCSYRSASPLSSDCNDIGQRSSVVENTKDSLWRIMRVSTLNAESYSHFDFIDQHIPNTPDYLTNKNIKTVATPMHRKGNSFTHCPTDNEGKPVNHTSNTRKSENGYSTSPIPRAPLVKFGLRPDSDIVYLTEEDIDKTQAHRKRSI